MDIAKRLDYLVEHVTSFTEQDGKQLARLHLKVKAKVHAEKEEQNSLADLKHANSTLIAKKVDLTNLRDLLGSYFHAKGIKQSMFTVDDMLGMIHADIRLIEDNLFDNQASEKAIQTLLDNQ